MHADVAVAVATTPHRAQRGRRTPSPRLVLGEDVIELVATAAQAADVRPLAVAILEIRLRRRIVIAVVVVVLLGKAEVDERAVPGITEGHS